MTQAIEIEREKCVPKIFKPDTIPKCNVILQCFSMFGKQTHSDYFPILV